MTCSKCKKDLIVEELSKKIKCDYCASAFCQACSGISSTEVRVLQLAGRRVLKFICDKCNSIQKVDYLKDMQANILQEMNKVYENFTNKIQEVVSTEINKLHSGADFSSNILDELKEIKSCQEDLKCSIETQTTKEVKSNQKSYSAAAKEVVVIKPKNQQESIQTKKAIQKIISPSDLEVGIKNVRNVKEGGIVIECQSEEEVEKIKKVAEQKLIDYDIKIPNRKNPCIKIIGIEDSYTTEEVKQMILKQNAFLLHDKMELEVKLVKKMKTLFMSIVECDPVTFNKIMEKNKLSIGWCYCTVFEHVKIMRCFKCGGFNHMAKNC